MIHSDTIRISELAGLPVSVTHFKATGKDNWGQMAEAVALIQKARDRGVAITADQYPFDQSAPIGCITELIDIPPDMEMEPSAGPRSVRRNRDLSAEQRAELRRRFVEELPTPVLLSQLEPARSSPHEFF